MRLLLSIIIIVLSFSKVQAGFSDLFKLNKLKNEYSSKNRPGTGAVHEEIIGSIKHKKKPELFFTLAGNLGLYLEKENQIYYPLISDSETYDFFNLEHFSENPFINALDRQGKELVLRQSVPDPDTNGEILYKESQLLLQEFTHKQVDLFHNKKLDLVFFTGNQVYSNNQIDHFYTIISESLDKYQIPHYEVLGENETRGHRDIKKEMKDFYYLLQTKDTNFIILNNVKNPVLSANPPYDANEQHLWLEKILAKLERENLGEDLIIITYKEPSETLINKIREYTHLNLIAFIYGEYYEFKEEEYQGIVFISSPSLSKYPLSYLSVHRNPNGIYNFKEVLLELPGMQEMANSRAREKL